MKWPLSPPTHPRSRDARSSDGGDARGAMPTITPNVATPNARFPNAPKAKVEPESAAESRPSKRSRSPDPLPNLPPPGHVGPPALLLGWVEAQDPRYDNATYYFHTGTKQTSWTRPEEPRSTMPPPSKEWTSKEWTMPKEWAMPPPLPAKPRQRQSPEIEKQLDDWVTAKRQKDYEVADGLRALLKVLCAQASGGRARGGMRWGACWGVGDRASGQVSGLGARLMWTYASRHMASTPTRSAPARSSTSRSGTPHTQPQPAPQPAP